jgi:pyruvate/2-oxoglutarate dehydrogenase complex dihydrolipoamide dehydrogenase (E3) component
VNRVQVAVVGAGHAGVTAAWAAATHGAETILLEEQASLSRHTSSFTAGKFDEQSRESQVDVRLSSVVWGLFEDNVLGVVDGMSSYQLGAEQIILATGSTDLPCPFVGGSLPGVFTSRAVRTMLREWRVMPGNRYVVIGDGVEANEITTDIEALGGQVVTRVRTSEAPQVRAIGHKGVEAVELNGARYEAEVVVVAVGRQPDIELALMAECALGYSDALGGFVPIRDENLRTSVSSVLVAGDVAGLCDQHSALYEGNFAGISAAHALGLIDDSMLEDERARYLELVGERATLGAQLSPAYLQV